MENETSDSAGVQEVSSPRFAAFYNWMTGRPLVRRMFDPLRREIVGQAHGIVLEMGAGGGQNFPFYDPARVERVEAVELDEAMLIAARRALSAALVPITLTRAPGGDLVVDIGCGTGLNFPWLQEAVGPQGSIIGVDLTNAMLEQARLRVAKEGWKNIELVQADAASYAFPAQIERKWDELA